MVKKRTEMERRITVKDLLAGRGIKALGDLAPTRATAGVRREVKVFDPEVRFISPSGGLPRKPAGGDRS